tara:strand:+ start:834 stop:1307 length:474 start_codon:yes stop_codon:yes gene_type:complete
MSKEILVEALEVFKFSPNGWDNKLTEIGQEFYMSETIALSLKGLNPPLVAILGEFKPEVFHEDIIETKEEELAVEEAEQVEALAIAVDVDENPLEDIEAIVKNAEDGADEIELSLVYKAVQKSGKWYDIYKFDEKVNEKGVARNKVARFVHELMSEV